MRSEQSNTVIELETKIAYLEDTVDSLNDVICEHETRVSELERICKHLYEKLETINDNTQQAKNSPGSNSQIDHEIPPHY